MLSSSSELRPAYPDYLWYPGALDNATHSGEYLAAQLATFPHLNDEKKLDRFIHKKILVEGLGVLDASEDEVKRLKDTKTDAGYTLSDIVSRRAQIGWGKFSIGCQSFYDQMSSCYV